MSFGDVIRSAAFTQRNDMNGIGGDANAIWLCGTGIDWVCELSTVDLSAIRFTGAPNGYVQGIGGDINTIWSCGTYTVRRVYELSTVNLATIRSAPSPATWPVGIGGNANTIWCIDGLLYELSAVDFSAIRSASAPASSGPTGIGGDANTIWFCDTTFNRVYELSTTDFSVVRYTNSPSHTPTGIGGDADTMWSCDGNVRQVYELDADVAKTISGTITSRSGIPLSGATVTIDGNTDTTDASGQYSITIAPGTYTITAEYSLFKTISQALVVSADMTQDLTLYKVEGTRKFTGRGASLEGGTSCGMGKRRR